MSKKSKNKLVCMFCKKKIVLAPGSSTTWIHLNNGESKSNSTFPHNAKPY